MPDGRAVLVVPGSEAAVLAAAPVVPEPEVQAPAEPPAAPPAASLAPLSPPPPAPLPATGSGQQALINDERDANGLPALAWSDCLAGVAAGEAVRMAREGAISHGAGLGGAVACGHGGGAAENVGVWSAGVNDAQLHSMFVNSPGHLANLLGPFLYMGAAWSVGPDGRGYLAVEFA